MVLRCQCGGCVEIQTANETKDDDGFVTQFSEKYECVSCKKNGWLHADSSGGTNTEELTGCLTANMEYY